MITNVKLKNWRSHLESEFKFSNGTNALLGSMGSGKSSTMDAICFAFFGTFPNLQTKKLKLDDVIMKKPSEKNQAEVEINFKIGNSNYSLKRVIEKGKGTTYSEIRENGKLLEAPNSQRVTEIVENSLKVNYELFSKAIYSEQNAIDYFLTIPKGQRMKKIDELLAIDKFERARSSAVSLSNKISERKAARQTLLDESDVKELEKIVFEIRASLTEAIKEKEMISQELLKTSQEKSEMEEELKQLESVKDNWELVKGEQKKVDSLIGEIKIALVSMQDSLKGKSREEIETSLEDLKNKLATLEKSLKEKRQLYEKIASSVNESKGKLEFMRKEKILILEKQIQEKLNLKQKLDEIRKKTGDDIPRQLEEKKKNYEMILAEFQELNLKINDLAEVINYINSSEGLCPVCDTKLSEERKNLLIQQKQLKISEFKKKLEEASLKKALTEKQLKTLEELSSTLQQMFNEVKDLEEIKMNLDNSKKMFVELTELVLKAENELTDVRRAIEKSESDFQEISRHKQNLDILLFQMKEYEEKEKRFAELMKEKEHIETRAWELEQKITEGDLENKRKKYSQLLLIEKELLTRSISLDQLIKEKETRAGDYETHLQQIYKQKQEIETFEKFIRDLKIFEKALQETQLELRKEFVEAVNFTMNDLWSTLYPYHDFVGIRLNTEEGDYILQLMEKGGRWMNVEGIASGGERSIAALALRIAFSLVLVPQLRWLILDEPTANLDRQAISVLATVLREKIGKIVDQTFLITHEEELEGAITGNAYSLSRDKEKDGITIALPLT